MDVYVSLKSPSSKAYTALIPQLKQFFRNTTQFLMYLCFVYTVKYQLGMVYLRIYQNGYFILMRAVNRRLFR